MEKITRDNLLTNYNVLKEKRDELKKKEYSYKVTKPINCYGMIAKMNAKDLVCAFASVKKNSNDYSAIADELGLVGFDSSDAKYLDIPFKDWETDFKTRAEQLNDAKLLKKYDAALALLQRNLSDEDKFNMDMQSISALIGE